MAHRRSVRLILVCSFLLMGVTATPSALQPANAGASSPPAPSARLSGPGAPRDGVTGTVTGTITATGAAVPATSATVATVAVPATSATVAATATKGTAVPATATVATATITATLVSTATPSVAATGAPTVTAVMTTSVTATPAVGVTGTATATITATATMTTPVPPAPTPSGVQSAVATGAPSIPALTEVSSPAISATSPSTASVIGSVAALPLAFEANQGQAAGDVSFVAHTGGATMLFDGRGATVALPGRHLGSKLDQLGRLGQLATQALTGTDAVSGTVLGLQIAGASAAPRIVGEDKLPGYANYLIGRDAGRWHTGIPTYARVAYQGVAPGVDVVYYGTRSRLEYDYQLAPGTDPGAITLTVAGAHGLDLDGAGNLLLHTTLGDLRQSKPVAYQEINGQRRPVDAHYVVRGKGAVGFAVGAYDPSQPLTIDPVLSYSAYLGGSKEDVAQGVAVDGKGNPYIVGKTMSSDFPTTSAYSSTFAGPDTDVFVAKLSTDGRTVLYSTYLGGAWTDYGYGIAANGAGNAYVAGLTWSGDFPTTSGAYQTRNNGSDDAFVAELSADGRSLVYSTFLGGGAYDIGYALALDGGGNAYVAGTTVWDSLYGAFPTTANAYQAAFHGGDSTDARDAFLAKLSPDGSQLLYSTLLGGSGNDEARGVAVDARGVAYIAGMTDSRDFPTKTTLQSAYGGGNSDAFVAKIDTTASGGASLIYSMYLGGSGDDAANGVAIDDSGAYVVGQTSSTDFPVTNAYQSAYGGGASDAFLTKVNVNATALAYSSYLGGSGEDEGYGVAAGGLGGTAITGRTNSPDFPTTGDALQNTWSGSTDADAFVAELNSNAGGQGSLGYSTYLHGSSSSDNTYGWAIANDGQSNVVVVGETRASDLPGATGTQQPPSGGDIDAFVSKFITTPTCPSGLDCVDIGDPALSGDQLVSGSRAAGTWAVQGSGSDIWNASDQFHFVAEDAVGDGAISARLDAQDNTGAYAKAGLMYRASEDPQAPYYDLMMTPNNGGMLQVQYRGAAGATAQDLTDVAASLPLYLKIGRAGNQFTAYTSSDGRTWSALPNSTVTLDNMPGGALQGLSVDSFNTGATSTATFDSVTFSACPAGWDCADIGGPGQTGTQDIRGGQAVDGSDGDAFVVHGGGADIEGTSDQFRYMYTTLSGDGGVSARVTGQAATDQWAKAGVMLRASADPGAPYYFVMVTPGNGVDVQYRATPGAQGGTTQFPVQLAGGTPLYLRAERAGTTFSAYTSHDGVNWALAPNSTVSIAALSGDLLAGPAVTAHNNGALGAATFDFLRVDQCPDAWSCADIGAPAVPGDQYLSNGVFSIRGVGTGIGSGSNTTQDQFRYAWRNITGDGGLSARLVGQVDTATQAKAGLMYRASNDLGAPFYLAALTANNGLVVQERAAAGGAVTTVATDSSAALPLYLQIVRAGNTFTAYTSDDDATWVPVANASVSLGAMPATAQLGLAVDAADPNATNTAVFDTVDVSGTADTAPAAGADLTGLDTQAAHYTQGTGGDIRLQAYSGPMGIPDAQWQWRDPSLAVVTTTGMLAPANLPFTETIAASSAGMATPTTGPALASLTSQDGVTLSVGLSSAGASSPSSAGQVRGNAVTFAAAEPSDATPAPSTSSDLSLRSTISGLAARVVLHSAAERGPFSLTLASTPDTQFMQDADGTIEAVRTITDYYDDGVTPYTTTQTEYIAQPPILTDSSTAITAAISTGPATTTLTTAAAGTADLMLNVDPAWLADPNRVFPVTLDLPIVTSGSLMNSGIWGTVNSCAPTAPAPQTEVVVGAAGGCAYNGQAYFDLTSLPDDTSVVSASLRLYTPNQTATTGIQVYQNAPTSTMADPSTPPSWTTAPIVMTGTASIAQSGSDGHWQSWDVTNLVQGWIQDSSTNAGLTLTSGGNPIRFASPFGAGIDAPGTAPYLDITYAAAPRPHAPYYDDGAKNIYGVSGDFTTSSKCKATLACQGTLRVNAVRGKNGGIGASLVRLTVHLDCQTASPNTAYWADYKDPTGGSYFNGDSIGALLKEAFDSGAVPILTLGLPKVQTGSPSCDGNMFGNPHTSSSYKGNWTQQMNSLVTNVIAPLLTKPGKQYSMYFEVGNETNQQDAAYFGSNADPTQNNYPPIFAAAASGLASAIAQSIKPGVLRYRVLTTGMSHPTASTNPKNRCFNPFSNQRPFFNVDIAKEAIKEALTQSGVTTNILGVAIHPYHYTTDIRSDRVSGAPFWRNFYQMFPYAEGPALYFNKWAGPCYDLTGVINTWQTGGRDNFLGNYFVGKHLPIVFTEENWSDVPYLSLVTPYGYKGSSVPNSQACGDPYGCEGAFLGDVITWLYDHRQFYRTNDPANSPLRVSWYRGANKYTTRGDALLGLYDETGQKKDLNDGPQNPPGTPNAPPPPIPLSPDSLFVCRVRSSKIPEIYGQLIRVNNCY